MRLSKIRIAGFKSFVDPTTLDLRSNLIGILGPNGCGKSNTIDAVRWVMGESSAKHLRGQSMEDVIFNGSSARKPVGQASVELVFDNSDGQLGGEYAQYTEISVKRQVSRDGSSKYFLNGSRCRRRDITDIFLGTGLGPRSYAIIEQGMISRLIEAKPEELRNTLEEAAGISRYKDRRRETENRIKHTRENLERLTDLRDELEKQLQKLDRQAKAAAKFKELRAEQHKLEALLLLLQETELQQQSGELTERLAEKSTEYQDKLTTIRTLDSKIEELRQQYTDANDNLNQVQGHYYQAGSEISRIEQTIQHQQDTRERQQKALEQLQQSLDETHSHAEEDRERLNNSREQLAELEPRAEVLQETLEQAEERLFDAEEQLNNWQEQWQNLQQHIADPTQQAQVEKTRMEQLEQQLKHHQQRRERLDQEEQNLSTTEAAATIATLEMQLASIQDKQQQAESRLEASTQTLQNHQQALQEKQPHLDQLRSRKQTLQGQLASLETLQQAELDKDNEAQQHWLKQQGLAHQPRLAEQLEVETGWETAVETVLGSELETVCVETLEPHLTERDSLPGISLLESTQGGVSAKQAEQQSLAARVQHPHTVKTWLERIFCAESLATALQQRQQLGEQDSFITRDGIWIGRHWIRIPQKQDKNSGVLQRQKTIHHLREELVTLDNALAELEDTVQQLRDGIQTLEEQKQLAQTEVNQHHREESTTTGQLNSLQQRVDELVRRQQQIEADKTELVQQQDTLHEALEQATEQRNAALMALEELVEEKEQLELEKDELYHARQNARSQLTDTQDDYNGLKLSIETHRQQIGNSQRQLERVGRQREALEQQHNELQEQLAEQDDPITLLQAELEEALVQRAEVEIRLNEARQQVQTLDSHVRTEEAVRVDSEKQADTLRDQQEQLKLDWQSVQVRLQNLTEQFEQTAFEREPLQTELYEHPRTEDTVQQRLQEIIAKIDRLGSINLAAIDEYQEQSERKVWLDQQNDDLITALETLESAIRKIDRETRSRFKETFDHVNSRLGSMFPRLFGGGECYLEMTDDDFLTTGIAIMARPPGKRISSIHLMSGGEKALTAVALVFAIFELNPAPFCMLDEVDAPLDEANVGRFCDLVGHMAERVQFIFITHNKRTMELANHLIGVTMREPGVSRLVAVDMDEAVKMVED